MVSFQELTSRVKDFLRFDRQELTGLIPAILVTAFIFSFKDWGEPFNIAIGLRNLIIVALIAAVSFFFRIGCQKIYALGRGYKADFKIWWAGLLIALVIAFISKGRIPLILAGTVVSALMIKQRLGEFRYGFSHSQAGVIALWGVLGNLILAVIFALGLFYFPQSFFFSKGLLLNLVMAICSLIPLPYLDGLQIYFGSRTWYSVGLLAVLLAGILLLLLPKVGLAKIGLIGAIVIGAISGIIFMLIGSEV